MSVTLEHLMRHFPTAILLAVAAPHLCPAYSIHGQLTNEVQNGVSLVRSYDSLNQYTAISNLCASVPPCESSLAYDADGNTTSDGRFTYFWNGENRLVCTSNAEYVVTYAYDQRGRMVRKEISRGGAETQRIEYLWDDWNIIR